MHGLFILSTACSRLILAKIAAAMTRAHFGSSVMNCHELEVLVFLVLCCSVGLDLAALLKEASLQADTATTAASKHATENHVHEACKCWTDLLLANLVCQLQALQHAQKQQNSALSWHADCHRTQHRGWQTRRALPQTLQGTHRTVRSVCTHVTVAL
jgi:hypothetical protein